jgi:hypothetical protein
MADQFLNHIVRVRGDETWVSFVNAETKEQSKQWMHTHSPNKQKKFKQTLSSCQKADGNCFLGQERSTDGGIYAKRDHDNVTSLLRNTKQLLRTNQKKRHIMLTSGVVLFHNNARPHTAARTRAPVVHFYWELFDRSERLTTCLPTWRTDWDHSASTIMRSWWKVSKRGFSHRRQTSLTHA